ncbi:glycoside hydrolase family 26 protein [Amycolatopsis sp. NBC_01286]|uniref:glycoside hydrolase family 26 protein n=1 Tax=Amycolatopsis sp. NBC_01286 TaxID=2903560 RepID=UPI002E10C33B|nr:glycoside hydrolase family 26 protein [Amycolatopsis sp. NBC_01286]
MSPRLRKTRTILAAAALVATALATPGAAVAGPRAGGTLNYLKQISGQYTIAGQHNKEPANQPSFYTGKAHDITGQYPGLWGGDFFFGGSDVANRQAVIDQAKLEWSHGAVVTMTWHMCPPTQGSSCDWSSGVMSKLSDAQWSELMTNGSNLNNRYKARLDEIVPYLQQLQNAGVQLLFRPLHELNDSWAWWGGRPGLGGSAGLYRITHDYLVGKGLTSIVWDWAVKDVNMGSIASYYPGDAYVDVAALDVWMKANSSSSDYQAMLNVSHGKPIALGETGTIPSPELLASQPKWTYFMEWSEYLQGSNSNAAIQRTYFDGRVLVLGEMQRG